MAYTDPHYLWAEMIKQEIMDLKDRMSNIEVRLDELKAALPTAAGVSVMPGVAPTPETTTVETFTGPSLYEVIVLTAQARRALYGYAMLLSEMGLSKDQKQVVQQLQYVTSMVLRLIQTIKILQVAMDIAAISTPMAVPYLFLAGGTLAASMMYGSRLSGG